MSMEIPTLAPESIVMLIIGLVVDFDFAMRRLRGFGRHILAQLPQYPQDSSVTDDSTTDAEGTSD